LAVPVQNIDASLEELTTLPAVGDPGARNLGRDLQGIVDVRS